MTRREDVPEPRRRPVSDREPSCVHDYLIDRPMSGCRICRNAPELAEWRTDWARWLQDNPDSPEARAVRAAQAARSVRA
jgi:hypothetical protein